jgi:hypothetical protein
MHIHAIHAGQAALALALAARTPGTKSISHSAQARAGRLPLIGPGTFLVAAYLGLRLWPNSLADSDRTDSHA